MSKIGNKVINSRVIKKFKAFSPIVRAVLFVVGFAVIGTILLKLSGATDTYGSIMTGSDQLVLQYEKPMVHSLVQNGFSKGAPPAATLYGNGLLLCSIRSGDHADSDVSPLSTMKQRQLNSDEIKAMFDMVRTLGFDNLLARKRPDSPLPPAALTSSVSLITSTGDHRLVVYEGENLAEFNAITGYIDAECGKATEDFNPDDVILESIKTDVPADSNNANTPDVPGILSTQVNQVQSSRLTGKDAAKAKSLITKGNKEFKTKDGKKIKVRLLPKVPEYQTQKLYTGPSSSGSVASAETYRKVRFLYVYAADQAQPADAQAVIYDVGSTLPGYYLSQVGKAFSTYGISVVQGSKTAAAYKTCPTFSSCSAHPGYEEEMATYFNLQTEFKTSGTNTIILHNWSNDGACHGLGGPLTGTDNVNVNDFGFAVYSSTNCWHDALYELAAHEGGHGFGLVHTCDATMMGACGYTKGVAYGTPLNISQANLLNSSSPYFNGPITTTQAIDPVLSGTTYLSVNPARMMDTRAGAATVDGQYSGIGRRSANSVTEVVIAGRAGIPSDALSVSLNIAALSPSTDGYLTIYPCGIAAPNTSNLNYVANVNKANFVISKLGSGKVCIYTSAATDLIIDVSGAFPAGSSTSYTNITPGRILDSRIGGSTADGRYAGTGTFGAGQVLQLPVASRLGIPSNASSASLNITIANPSSDGYATVYPCDGALPNTSTVNFRAGGVSSNAVISKIGNGNVCIYTNVATDVLVDANGAFNAVSAYTAILPSRLLDSRPGTSTIDGQYVGIGRRPAGTTTEVTVAGRGGIKADALVAALNVAVLNPSTDGYLTVYPCGTPLPNASNINFTGGSLVANFVISKLGSGKVCIYNNVDTDLLVDANGAFVSADVAQYGLSVTAPLGSSPAVTNDTVALQYCPAGYTGTYPNCVAPQSCPTGYTGTYPYCVPPQSCPAGYTGTYPNCTAPSVCSGMTIFKDANFTGASQSLTIGKYSTSQLIGDVTKPGSIGDNAISSAQIPSGCKLTLYDNDGFTGATQVMTSNWLGSASDPWNDRASSVEVSEDTIASGSPITCSSGGVIAYKSSGFGGSKQTFSIGTYDTSRIKIGNDTISAVRVAAGCKVILYQNGGFSGGTKVLTGNWSAAINDPWNDITSSIEVRNLQ